MVVEGAGPPPTQLDKLGHWNVRYTGILYLLYKYAICNMGLSTLTNIYIYILLYYYITILHIYMCVI